MTRTSLNRCSKLLIALLVCSALAVPAVAVQTESQQVPEEAEVGAEVTAQVTLTELYDEYETWQLAGQTELENVTWTVVYYDQTDAKVDQQSYDGQNFSGATVSAGDGTSRVVVKVRGTVPAVEQYSYDPAQTFLTMELRQEREGGTSNVVDSFDTHHYTAASDEARAAIDGASSAVDAAGSPSDAAELLDSAVSAFEAGNFDNAVTLAERAEQSATQTQNTQQRNQLIVYAVGGLLVVGVLGGGVAYYRSQQDEYDRLG
ncbi:MAG: hypothetical protein ABEJ79_01000 [Halolamina sp.]